MNGNIVALKKVRMDVEKDGLPLSGLREIQVLMACRHENVVQLKEVLVGRSLERYLLCLFFFLNRIIFNVTDSPKKFGYFSFDLFGVRNITPIAKSKDKYFNIRIDDV